MEFTRLEEVRAGWSGDRKYHAWDDGGQEFFLRLSQPEKWEKAQSAFALQEKAFQLGLPVSEPMPPRTTMTTTKVELSMEPLVKEKLAVESEALQQA